ncbi:SMI1/KNR4 family protein [Streptomyces sp. NPDC058231]|uniref:SMI1/KNR4 family protein n=1 Tax=Streptomyces sp. NPDC058231 TaxID=3346392 RepID=UPI0036E9A87A
MNRPSVPRPLTEAEVIEAEVELGVTFPSEYRHYLLRVSSGGAVEQLEKTENGWWWAGNSTKRRDLLPLPFPHPDTYEDADDEFYRRLPRAEDYADEDAFSDSMNGGTPSIGTSTSGRQRGLSSRRSTVADSPRYW